MLVFIYISTLTILILSILVPLFATRSLPSGNRGGIVDQSIDNAIDQLRASGKNGWELVADATLLVHQRMHYCRRNSFDYYKKAFRRGYGYCQQQAYALEYILRHLGFGTRVVFSFKSIFPDGKAGNHAWLQVRYGNETRNYCPVFPDPVTAKPGFEIVGPVHHSNGLFRIFAGWGSVVVNAMRYYQTGKDF